MKDYRKPRQVCIVLALCCLVLIALDAQTASARRIIDLGPKDQIAGDQPRAQIEVLSNDGSTSFGPATISDDPLDNLLGPTNTLLVDTGASSLFLMNTSETAVRQNGYQIENQVFEQGVSGFSLVNVSAPYQARITGTDGVTHTVTDNRLLSGQFPDLVGISGLIGMPAMVGRVMTMDLDIDNTGFDGNIDLDDLLDLLPSTQTNFSSTLPADPGHRYTVPMVAKSFDIEDTEGPLPTSAPLPMLTMEAGANNLKTSGQFIMDTGASISFISSEIAAAIGLDSNNDGLFNGSDEHHLDNLPIGGVGGTIDAAMFAIDSLSVATDQDVDLVWQGDDEIAVLVLDIHPEIDGVFGSDIITTGMLNLLGLGGNVGAPLDAVHFDFRNFVEEGDVGSLVLDLNPKILGDYNTDGVVDGNDLTEWQAEYGPEGYTSSNFLNWQRNFGLGTTPPATSAVPEPTSSATALAALLCMAARKRNRPN